MIQFFIQFCKSFYQIKYDEYVDSINFFSLRCSKCRRKGACNKHAYYTRQIVTDEAKQPIDILRVLCNHCDRTHALLPNWIVPYSQILLADHIRIIRLYEAGITAYEICNKLDHSHIDTNHIAYIIRQYHTYWQQRLLCTKPKIKVKSEEISQLVNKCFLNYGLQFMQIRIMENILFNPPT